PTDPSFDFTNGILAGFKQLVYGPHLSPAPSRSPSPSLPDSDLPLPSPQLSPLNSATALQSDGLLKSGGLDEPMRHDQNGSTPELPQLPTAEPLTRAEKRKQQEKLRSKENKRRKKEKTDEYIPRDSPSHAKKHLAGASHIPTSFEAEKMPISKAGFIALRSPDSATTYRLEDFIGPDAKFNMKLVTWNGEESMVTTDKVKRITSVCVSKPAGDESWEELQQRAAQAIESARSRLHFSKKDQDHRRGGFPALAVGISHGGGQPYPKMRRQDPRNQDALQDLLSEPAFERISGHATGKLLSFDEHHGSVPTKIDTSLSCTILIPSAAIHHSNVMVGVHERRYSVTQYSAGGIFRWIDNKFQSVVNFRGQLTEDERVAALEKLSTQLDFGLSLYSDIAELEKKHNVSFKYAAE
ncbi:hypothetical protein CVT26_006788, partial [Gymnopilus dilepis]